MDPFYTKTSRSFFGVKGPCIHDQEPEIVAGTLVMGLGQKQLANVPGEALFGAGNG